MDDKHFQEWIELKEKLHNSGSLPKISEGDVWWYACGENVRTEINGKSARFSRPVVILKKFGRYGFMGVPLTSQEKTGSWYVAIDFLGKKQFAALCQTRMISVARLFNKMGQLPKSDLEVIKSAFCKLFE